MLSDECKSLIEYLEGGNELGYYMTCRTVNFTIKNESKILAYNAIMELMGKSENFGHGRFMLMEEIPLKVFLG